MKRAILFVLIAVFAVTAAVLCTGCVVKTVKGELVTETYSLESADSFVLKNFSIKVAGKGAGPTIEFVSDGGAPSATVTMQEGMFDTVKLQQTGSKLVFSGRRHCVYLTDYEVKIVVKNCVFNHVDLVGAAKATAEEGCLGGDLYVDLSGASHLNGKNIVGDSIKFDLSGASDVSLDSITCSKITMDMSGASTVSCPLVTATDINADLSGASKVSFTAGEANSLDVDISGASSFDCPDFIVKDVHLDVSGASKVSFTANDGTITGDVSGASTVEYKGHATQTVDVSGGSSVKNV